MTSWFRNAKKVHLDGYVFDSQVEARRYEELRTLERFGKIRNLEVHPAFPIIIDGKQLKWPSGHKLVHKLDFRYFLVTSEGTQLVVEEVKARGGKKRADPKVSQLKRLITEAIYHIKITVVWMMSE